MINQNHTHLDLDHQKDKDLLTIKKLTSQVLDNIQFNKDLNHLDVQFNKDMEAHSCKEDSITYQDQVNIIQTSQFQSRILQVQQLENKKELGLEVIVPKKIGLDLGNLTTNLH